MDHVKDLSNKSDARGIFTFTAFLTPEEQSALLRAKRELAPFTLFGGAEGTERVRARFGDPDALGWEAPFDIVCLHVRPRGARFAETLTHRDFLGTLIGCGFERDRFGDIVVRENEAFVFTDEKTAEYLCRELTRVKRTAVDAEIVEAPPPGALFRTETLHLNAASARLDCVIGAVFRLSRGDAADLFAAKKVFVNGALCERPDRPAKPGDVISLRGLGKFRYAGEAGATKKGRLVFEAEKYV